MNDYSLESLPEPDKRTRRITRLLLFVWLALALIVGALLCYVISQAFRPVPIVPILVGELDEFPTGTVTLEYVNARLFDETARKEFETLPLQVVHDQDGTFTVFFARSTRPSEALMIPGQCMVEWDTSLEEFLELCGGSRWERDGTFISGAAPRNLDRFPARVEGNQLWIEPIIVKGQAHP